MTSPKRPRVSVLLPARNAAATLPTCLASLARQTEPHWECIAVDDASSDATPEILDRFAKRDPRLRIVRAEGRGLVAALERGRVECRAPVVARMDADDWMHRDRLRLQLEALDADAGLAALGTHVRIFPRSTLTDGRRAYERWLNSLASAESVALDAFVECPVAHPTLAIRNEALSRLGYRDVGWPEDLDLVLRLITAGERVAVLPRRLVGWRDHPGRLSRTHASYGLDRFTACKAAHLARGLLAGQRTYVLWGYGPTAKSMRKALLEHDLTPSHIVELHPRRIGREIHGAPVIAPEGLAALAHPRIVAAVAGAGPRARIRAWLTEHGHRDGVDFVCTA